MTRFPSSGTGDGTLTGLDIGEIRAAAERIAGHVHRTPVLSSPTIDARVAGSVFAKAEALQRGGSFKVRGAFNRLLLLDPAQRARGVVAYSSGNHGAAVSLAAAELGVPAIVVLPRDVTPVKLGAIRAHGAELVHCDPLNRARVAGDLAQDRGMTLVPPYDDYAVMAGQGTAALELIDEVGALDALVVPVSGGGLLAGAAAAVKAICPAARIIGVEPAGADDTARSLQAGERVTLTTAPDTIADGLRALVPGELTFPINRELLDEVAIVDDGQIVEAMRICRAELNIVVEPSGAAALAALTAGVIDLRESRVGVILTGGNVDPGRLEALLGNQLANPNSNRAASGRDPEVTK